MSSRAPLCLIACANARDLVKGIGRRLGVEPIPGEDVWFPAGEGKFVIGTNIRGGDVYILQRALAPGSERSISEGFLMALHAADAARLADAQRITLVLPYLPGTRQDKRKASVREGVSTGLFARMIEASGVSMVITAEPHSEEMVAAYDPRLCVMESVSISRAFATFLDEKGLVGDVVASPDVGGLENAREYAQILKRDLAALSKERDYSRTSTVLKTTVLGDVRGKDILLVDDIVDTGGSVVSAVHALWERGAGNVVVAAAHAIMSDPSWERMAGLEAEARDRGLRFAMAGTCSVQHENPPPWFHTFSLEPLLADVISRINTRGSVRAVEGG
ncbi:MAG: ribose-phosphate diphosphokinase [Pseudomonadota bacterium]